MNDDFWTESLPVEREGGSPKGCVCTSKDKERMRVSEALCFASTQKEIDSPLMSLVEKNVVFPLEGASTLIDLRL